MRVRQNRNVRLRHMRRSIPWAVAALLPPFALVALVMSKPEDSTEKYFAVYWFDWFAMLVGVCIAQMICFAVHAGINRKLSFDRRVLWTLTNFLLPFSASLYWWVYGDSAT